MSKKRTIQQKAEAKAKGELKSLLSEWVVNELSNDFGIDFEVRIADDISHKTQEISEISFYIQSKSTIKSKKDRAEEDLSIKDWKLYLGQRIPVLLVKYDINQRIFYWEIIQEYAWDVLDKEDQNWKRKRTKRIVLYKKLDDLDELKKAIIKAQNRITRFHSLNLSIGEGIKITEDDLTELEKSRDKLLFEYKALTLKESYIELKKGHSDKSFQLLMDVYNSPKNDEAKVRAIIGIIFEFNIAKPEENQKIVALANEAIKIASELNIEYLVDYIEILKNQALFYIIIKRMSEIQMSLQVQNLQNAQSFSFFYNQGLVRFNSFRESVINKINDSLEGLLEKKEIYYYIASLPKIIDLITIQTMNFSVFNRNIITQEKKARQKLIEEAEFILDKVGVLDLQKMLLRSLANYYYWTLEPDKAKEYMQKAIKIAREDKDVYFIKGAEFILEAIKKKPDPYEVPESKPIDEMTVEEYQEMTKKLLETQGIKLTNGRDYLTEAISIGIRDMNPKPYFEHCKNLHIGYVNTSPVGISIGLPSMGTKFIWCKHCKSSLVFDVSKIWTLHDIF